MSKKITFVLHPSFSKTGTTTLQEILKELNISILAKPSDNPTSSSWFYLFKEHLFENDNINKKSSSYKYSTSYLEKIQNFKKFINKKINDNTQALVLSDEGFFGSFFYGLGNIFILKKILKEIEKENNLVFELKLVFTIRRPTDIIKSYFFYFPILNEKYSFLEFVEALEKNDPNVRDYFCFLKIINFCETEFSTQILILPLEEYINEPSKYLEKLFVFLNQKNLEKIKNKKLFNIKTNTNKGTDNNYLIRKKNFSSIYLFISNFYSKFLLQTKIIKFLKKNEKIHNFIKMLNNKLLKIFTIKDNKNEEDISQYDSRLNDIFENEIKQIEKKFNLNLKKFNYFN